MTESDDRPTPDDSILSLIDLTKVYSSRKETITAVDHINLEMRRGEIFSLLGPNGAGKTTTFRMIATLESPTEGRIMVDGLDAQEDPDGVRNIIGLVPQGESYYQKLTGEEFMDLMGTLYGVQQPLLRERIDELLDLVGLDERRESLIGTYSGGMKQRLSLAAGLIHRPKLLLLDEPTTGLDPQTRRRLWNTIRDLNEEGVTIFINTHIMEEADALSDRVGVMNRGELVAVDTPENLKRAIKGGESIHLLVEHSHREKARMLLEGHDLVKRVSTLDGKMELITDDRSRALSTIPQFLSEEGVNVKSIEVPEPTLEDAFIKLTGGP